jgi:hypothetical protein
MLVLCGHTCHDDLLKGGPPEALQTIFDNLLRFCAGVLFYGDSAAEGVKASTYVEVSGLLLIEIM